ncbi:uncharacterized protein BO66DRAFT_69971 [Aspergillus aculeatinus CBS 121060]|uniref:Uncharacterized protein n=1 Tax=Aspergillus aculeatinus CBS 121060 TaxID=1448322 RepID=A0ACD1HN89_9EURO|nr:hypothetical protein BO66DRAFT_69971 [Aspergillus aculeatinus CBS 121060]RAH74927.1 hypothetical protein BO66DRAFT_69971 [Aspergillus aculeatinus CBS 121060]
MVVNTHQAVDVNDSIVLTIHRLGYSSSVRAVEAYSMRRKYNIEWIPWKGLSIFATSHNTSFLHCVQCASFTLGLSNVYPS